MNTPAIPVTGSADVVIAEDPAMLGILETARTIARHHTAVLITGETGSGKEVVARLIHRCSTRGSRPWIDVNCAALPEHLVESELFGYEKGAFSGADAAKPGLFELANGGTLFLDEIGEIDPRVQVKLLRVLDAVPFYRLGGHRKVAVDVRLIAATNRNLLEAVRSGAFRRDLFHRITEFHIGVPPLRERPADIAALAVHFLTQQRPDVRFTNDALDLLMQQPWPGNVRELRNVVTKLSMFVATPLLSAAELRRHIADYPATPLNENAETALHPGSLSEMERMFIVRALEATGGNQSQAAARLGVPRRTFCRKLNEYHITLGRRQRDGTQAPSIVTENRRTRLNVPVKVQTNGGECTLVEATDLSMGGMGLRDAPATLEVESEVTLTFSLLGHEPSITLGGTVAWIRPDGSAGVKFASLSPATHKLLGRWMQRSLESPPIIGEPPQRPVDLRTSALYH
ncbi:MAG: sigma 54-interacting transcriptional regulator [Candidatus Korobacteraceae bacterium]